MSTPTADRADAMLRARTRQPRIVAVGRPATDDRDRQIADLELRVAKLLEENRELRQRRKADLRGTLALVLWALRGVR